MNHFFDVGASVGSTFELFLDKTHEHDGWRVWCVEPSPRHLGKLIEAVNSRSGRYQSVICPFGLGDRSGVSEFYIKQDFQGDSFLMTFGSNAPIPHRTIGAIIDVVSFLN